MAEYINGWKIVKLDKPTGKSTYYIVNCPKCGKEYRKQKHQCLSQQRCRQCYLSETIKHKDCGSIPGWYFNRVELACKRVGRTLSVTIQYLDKLFKKQNGKCALSGMDLAFTFGSWNAMIANQTTASLDRIDSSKGYIKGNLQWIHKEVNNIKQDKEQARFIELCTLIAKHQGGFLG